MIARNVKVAESVTWNWETTSIEGIKQKQQIEIDVAEDDNVIDDKLVRGQDLLLIFTTSAMLLKQNQ